MLGGEVLTFDQVEERLIEAMLVCWRSPDRERGWQQVRSLWPEVTREVAAGDYDARGVGESSSDVALRPASLTRREVAEMEEAFGWLGAVDGGDRKVIGLAISHLARGAKQVPWRLLLRPMGLDRGADGLRMRYGRAITRVVRAANAEDLCGVEGVKV